MSNSWARPGAKCVCIRVSQGGYGDEISPVIGETYTVRDAEARGNEIGIRLVELVNQSRIYRLKDGSIGPGEIMFSAGDFRPVVPTKTQAEDVALIKSLLAKTPEHAQ